MMTEYKDEVENQRKLLILEKYQDRVDSWYLEFGRLEIRYWNGKLEVDGEVVEEPMSLENQWRKYEVEKYYEQSN